MSLRGGFSPIQTGASEPKIGLRFMQLLYQSCCAPDEFLLCQQTQADGGRLEVYLQIGIEMLLFGQPTEPFDAGSPSISSRV